MTNNEKSLPFFVQSILVKSGVRPSLFFLPYGSKVTTPICYDGCRMSSLQGLIEVCRQIAAWYLAPATGNGVMRMGT